MISPRLQVEVAIVVCVVIAMYLNPQCSVPPSENCLRKPVDLQEKEQTRETDTVVAEPRVGPAQVDHKHDVKTTLFAMNHLNKKFYTHHPVMLSIGQGPYPMEKGFITEWNGLKVPAEFDCDLFYRPDNFFQGPMLSRVQEAFPESKLRMNTETEFWGNHHYFTEVQSRFYACWQHVADINSGTTLTQPSLPIVDDEYNEQTTIYQSVLRAKDRFVIAELGARWGTWGTRSIAFLKHARPTLPYTLFMIEANPENCVGMDRVLKKNDITATTICGMADETNFRAWSETVPHIDIIDFDIQTAEEKLVPAIMDILNKKTYRVIVGAHARWVNRTVIYDKLLSLFREEGWIEIFQIDPTKNMRALDRYLRAQNTPTNDVLFNWESLLKVTPSAVHETPRGPVAHCDGELIFDNPRFVNKAKKFSLDDTELRVDDLY